MVMEGEGASANIIVTQPRRISAVGVAERIAAERAERIGETAGYVRTRWDLDNILRVLPCIIRIISTRYVFITIVRDPLNSLQTKYGVLHTIPRAPLKTDFCCCCANDVSNTLSSHRRGCQPSYGAYLSFPCRTPVCMYTPLDSHSHEYPVRKIAQLLYACRYSSTAIVLGCVHLCTCAVRLLVQVLYLCHHILRCSFVYTRMYIILVPYGCSTAPLVSSIYVTQVMAVCFAFFLSKTCTHWNHTLFS